MEKNLYSFKVNLIVQVFAESEDEAKALLDQNGFITARNIELAKVTPLFNEL